MNFHYRTNSVNINDWNFSINSKNPVFGPFLVHFPSFWGKTIFRRKSSSATYNFKHSIFTTWPVDSLFFTVRKYNFFRRILELSRPIFQKNFNFQKFGHRTVLFSSDDIIWSSSMIYNKAVFELFQNLHFQIYASQFMTS